MGSSPIHDNTFAESRDGAVMVSWRLAQHRRTQVHPNPHRPHSGCRRQGSPCVRTALGSRPRPPNRPIPARAVHNEFVIVLTKLATHSTGAVTDQPNPALVVVFQIINAIWCSRLCPCTRVKEVFQAYDSCITLTLTSTWSSLGVPKQNDMTFVCVVRMVPAQLRLLLRPKF
jgi:hypothetical protein